MSKFTKLFILAATLAAAGGVQAFSPAPTAGEPEIGVWHGSAVKCRQKAEAENIPVVIVGSAFGCAYCNMFHSGVLDNPRFKAWMKDSPYLFCHVYSGTGSWLTTEGLAFEAWVGLGGLPRVSYYWKKPDGTIVGGKSVTVAGRDHSVDWYINRFETAFKDYQGGNSYKGGTFVTGETAATCLQAEPTTTFVEVPMTREKADAVTQAIRISSERKTATETVTWAAGVVEQNYRIEGLQDYYSAGKDVTLELLDEENAVQSTTKIACVATQANSAINPYWMGERTADTLNFGEWTIDVNMAQDKVRAFKAQNPGAKAYTLVLVSGALWCPDCEATDRNLFDRAEFRDWAVRNNVALGVVDVSGTPQDETSAPSLLDYRPGASGTSGEAVKSGAGYLSRKNATKAVVDEVFARNKALAGNGAAGGGLNTAARAEAGEGRPFVPTLVLLRDDTVLWSIAGRLDAFGVTAPAAFSANYLTRLDELLAQYDLAEEERNDDYRTTLELLPSRGTVTKTLSHTDRKDVYSVPGGARMVVSVTSAGADASAKAKLSFIQVSSTGAMRTLASSDEKELGVGAALDYTLPADGVCYFVVEASGAYFDVDKSGSSVCSYTIATDTVLIPGNAAQTATFTDGVGYASFKVSGGMTYKITGIDKAKLAGYTDYLKNSSGDLYVAHTLEPDVVATLPLLGDTVTYQIWETGSLGFLPTAATVAENARTYSLAVVRTGGSSGKGGARISVDWESSSPYAREVCRFDADGSTHEWPDGTAATWNVPVTIIDDGNADGAQTVVFRLAPTDDSDVSVASGVFTLTIQDNDRATPGKLKIAGSEPAQTGTSPVYAKEGTQVRIDLTRVEGSGGSVGCTLKATAGTLDKTSFTWGGRDTSVQSAYFTVPAYQRRNQQITLTLTPDRGVQAVASARTLKIQVVAAVSPEFAVAEKSFGFLYRNVDMRNGEAADTTIPVVNLTGRGAVRVTRISGSVPSGITATYDSALQALVVKGTPTAATVKPMSAVFRVSEGTVDGSTVTLNFNVIDPAKPVSPGSAPLNPSVAKSRTLSDLVVHVTDASMDRMTGLLTVTIPPTGRVSARYTCAAGVVSLSAKGWSKIDGNGTLHAVLAGTTARTAAYSGGVSVDPNGGVAVSLFDPAYSPELLFDVIVPSRAWSRSDSAAAWEGYYTVSMPQENVAMKTAAFAKGDGYLTLRMAAGQAAQGRVTYAGSLPNGKSYSGSAVLIGTWDGDLSAYVDAQLPIYRSLGTDVAAGLVRIMPNARRDHKEVRRSVYPGTDFFWTCKEADQIGAAYETKLGVYGGYYDSNEDFESCCSTTFETTDLTFFVLPEGLVHPDDGSAAVWDTTDTGVKVEKRNAISLVNRRNAQNLTLSFAKANGTVSGSLRLHYENGKFATATYRGIVLPGWGTAACAVCNPGLDETRERPFISGACWFNERLSGQDARGQRRTVNVKRGCPISVGSEAGK